ncbi:MAG: hypothetical protein WBV85_08920 [Solirubrobacteraceae bacterium]
MSPFAPAIDMAIQVAAIPNAIIEGRHALETLGPLWQRPGPMREERARTRSQ